MIYRPTESIPCLRLGCDFFLRVAISRKNGHAPPPYDVCRTVYTVYCHTAATAAAAAATTETKTGFYIYYIMYKYIDGPGFFFFFFYPLVTPLGHPRLLCPTYSVYRQNLHWKRITNKKKTSRDLIKNKKYYIPFDIRSVRWPDDSWMPILSCLEASAVLRFAKFFFYYYYTQLPSVARRKIFFSQTILLHPDYIYGSMWHAIIHVYIYIHASPWKAF